MIEFACSSCDTTLKAPVSTIGAHVQCPKCRAWCEVPDPDAVFVGAPDVIMDALPALAIEPTVADASKVEVPREAILEGSLLMISTPTAFGVGDTLDARINGTLGTLTWLINFRDLFCISGRYLIFAPIGCRSDDVVVFYEIDSIDGYRDHFRITAHQTSGYKLLSTRRGRDAFEKWLSSRQETI